MRASGIQPPGPSRIDGVPSKRWQLRHGVIPWTPPLPSISPSELRAAARPRRRAAAARRAPPRALRRQRPRCCPARCIARPRTSPRSPRAEPPRERRRLLRPRPRRQRRTPRASLRAAGWDARFLQGGIEGGEPGVDRLEDIAHWRATPLPRMRKRPDLGVTGERPSRWITRERPKIDRIACPWLIRRFIDPRAEFFYVPTDAGVRAGRRGWRPCPTTSRARRSRTSGSAAASMRCCSAFDLHDAGARRAGDHRARRRHRPAGAGAAVRPACWRSRWACRACTPTTTRCWQAALPRVRRAVRLVPRGAGRDAQLEAHACTSALRMAQPR